MDNFFNKSISCFLKFLDDALEKKYIALKQRIITPQLKIFLLIVCIGIAIFISLSLPGLIQSAQNNPRYSFPHELFQFLLLTSSLIIEIIIFCIYSFYFLRGTILNSAIIVYITDITWAQTGTLDSMNSNNFPLLILINSNSFCYIRSWFPATISIGIGLSFYFIVITSIRSHTIFELLNIIFSCIYLQIIFTLAFYQQDTQNRKDFFNLEMSRKKKKFMKSLFKEIPVPILVIYPTYKYINEPFKYLFLNSPNSSRTVSPLTKKEKQLTIESKLNEFIEKKSKKKFPDFPLDEITDKEAFRPIFEYFDGENKTMIDLQIKGIKLSIEEGEISIFLFHNLSEFQVLEKKLEKNIKIC